MPVIPKGNEKSRVQQLKGEVRSEIDGRRGFRRGTVSSQKPIKPLRSAEKLARDQRSPVQSQQDLENLILQLLHLIENQDISKPETQAVAESEGVLDWLLDNIPKGIQWVSENVLPVVGPMLAML